MLPTDELELPHLPIETPEFAADPTPYFERARRQHPWLARCGVGLLVTEYQAMKDILARDDKLQMPGAQIVDIMGAHGTGWGRFVVDQMLVSSGERHARLRGSVAEAFTPRAVNRSRALMREVVADLLEAWAPSGAFDFVDFAAQFPIQVMFGLIGADPAVIPAIQSSLEIHGSSFDLDTTRMPVIEAAYQHLWEFVNEVIAERGTVAGRGDLLDDLVAANTSGALSDVELRQILILLFAAGYDTTKNMLTLIMHAMLQAPADWARCAEDRPFCNKVVEEALRHASPSSTYRIVTEPFDYRDVVFAKDAMIVIPLSIAGRDSEAFPNAQVFDPERVHANRQIAFGRGMHMCLGQFLARANLEEGVHLMAQRLTRPRLAGEVAWRPFPGVWGISSLPIEFDPAPARA
jgi:cytochrome P450